MVRMIEVPAQVIRDYLAWLKRPQGVSFGFCVMTRKGLVDVTLPLVKLKK